MTTRAQSGAWIDTTTHVVTRTPDGTLTNHGTQRIRILALTYGCGAVGLLIPTNPAHPCPDRSN